MRRGPQWMQALVKLSGVEAALEVLAEKRKRIDFLGRQEQL